MYSERSSRGWRRPLLTTLVACGWGLVAPSASAQTTETLRVNFQPASASVPSGFEVDDGSSFGARANGNTYGWRRRVDGAPLSAAGAARERGAAGVPQPLDTLIHLQRGDCCGGGFTEEIYWELQVPAGRYEVTVAAGDPSYSDSVHALNVEGVAAVAPTAPTGGTPLLGTVTIDVVDGALTVDADGGTNTKILYVEITDVSPPPPPPPGGGCIPDPSQFPGASVSPLACAEVKISAPLSLTWDVDEGAIATGSGEGTGFTMVLPTTNGDGLRPDNLAVAGGRLAITTTSGIVHSGVNSQDNGLGVGLPLPDATYRIATTLVMPPAGTGAWEQAGLWFGVSERDYLKLVFADGTSGLVIQALVEQGDGTAQQATNGLGALPAAVQLELIVDPTAETAAASYTIAGSRVELGTFSLPSLWFSKDAAGIDFTVGTRSYAGIFATHRNRSAQLPPLVYEFEQFSVAPVDDGGAGPGPTGAVDFERWSIGGIGNPTALAWGPDDRLYASTASGLIKAYTLDRDGHTVLATEDIAAVANRLVLGLTVDPASTPDDVVLWVSHSDLSQNSGDANSGTMSRLSGPGFSVREDRIVGLPRAIANHAPNGLHFGPDGWLYMVIGGNTGAGAANDGGSEFGPRPEQPLSAAILRADPYALGFDGDCRSEVDPDGVQMDATGISARDVPCDVEVYASGLRNSYDFSFHSNGRMYATDNGLGVEGTAPALPLGWLPGDLCEGPVNGSANRDANNPGRRPDLLYEVQAGDYFGHPNPSRDECVFFAGNPTPGDDAPVAKTGGGLDHLDTDIYDPGRSPEAGWKPALFSFSTNKSANGIVEYTSQSFCGALAGDLLVTYYSQQDQVRRLTLGADGLSVVSDETLIRSTSGTGGTGLSNPLPIAQDPQGNIYVGEFGAGRIAVFDPIGPGCWQAVEPAPLPVALLDAGGASVGDTVYVVGGKTASEHQRSLYAYDASDDAWTRGPDLPADYPAIENPAVVAVDGRVYVFGGSTQPFSGAVAKAAVYDPATGAWAMLPDMPSARGGPGAAVVGDQVLIVGGMNGSGTSLATVDAFDLVTATWSTVPSMTIARDNPMVAAVDGELLVFGGRTRQHPTLADDPTLASAEIYSPSSGEWRSGVDMPTGRRTGGAIVVDGQVLVMGGEAAPGGATFVAVEAYDPATDAWSTLADMPVGRHGAVYGRIGSAIFVVGGGPTAGSSFTSDVDVFHYR